MLTPAIESMLREAELLEARAAGLRQAARLALEGQAEPGDLGYGRDARATLNLPRRITAHKIWALLKRVGVNSLEELAQRTKLDRKKLHQAINGKLSDSDLECRRAIAELLKPIAKEYHDIWGEAEPKGSRDSVVSKGEVEPRAAFPGFRVDQISTGETPVPLAGA